MSDPQAESPTIESAPREPSPGASAGASGQLSLLSVAAALLRHRRSVAGLPLVGAALFSLWPFLLPPPFTSGAAFTAQLGQSDISRFSGVAAQLGFALPAGGGGESAAFYEELIGSRELLRRVARHDYAIFEADDGAPRTGDLVTVLQIEGDTDDLRLERAVDDLLARLRVRLNFETGVVRYEISTPWPSLSHQIAQRMLDEVNAFNLERRRLRASAEKNFLAAQLAEARANLIAAEDSLRAFLEANRRIEDSPELSFAHDRLQRRVNLRQQVFTVFAHSYEEARIEEVRNTPVVTVLELPRVPARRDAVSLLLRVAVGLVVGLAGAVLWALGHELVARARLEEPQEYRELESELRRIWKRGERSGTVAFVTAFCLSIGTNQAPPTEFDEAGRAAGAVAPWLAARRAADRESRAVPALTPLEEVVDGGRA